jgi:hypothetical protein
MDALGTLQRLANGKLIEEVYDALARTAEEVVATGKSGTVTVTLKVSTKNQGDPFVIVEEVIARSAPKKDPRGAYFFALDGELHKSDPRQTRLEFRTVDHETGEVREFRDETELREAN